MHQVTYGTKTIAFKINRTDRKTLAIEVHPDSTVQLIAPENATLPDIKEKIVKRGRWILKQQYYFEQFLPHTQTIPKSSMRYWRIKCPIGRNGRTIWSGL